MSKTFIKKEKVRFQHCDNAGIVFYPRYFVMLNDLVEDWFQEELGLSFQDMHPNGGVPSVNLKADFRNPSTIGDILTKNIYVADLGNKSVVYKFQFLNQKEQVIVEGEGTLVAIEKNSEGKMKAVKWSDEIRNNMQKFVH